MPDLNSAAAREARTASKLSPLKTTITSEFSGASSTIQNSPAKRSSGTRTKYKITRNTTKKIRNISLKMIPPRCGSGSAKSVAARLVIFLRCLDQSGASVRQNLDVPVIIFRDAAPVFAQLALGLLRAGRRVHHQMIARRNLQQTAQR